MLDSDGVSGAPPDRPPTPGAARIAAGRGRVRRGGGAFLASPSAVSGWAGSSEEAGAADCGRRSAPPRRELATPDADPSHARRRTLIRDTPGTDQPPLRFGPALPASRARPASESARPRNGGADSVSAIGARKDVASRPMRVPPNTHTLPLSLSLSNRHSKGAGSAQSSARRDVSGPRIGSRLGLEPVGIGPGGRRRRRLCDTRPHSASARADALPQAGSKLRRTARVPHSRTAPARLSSNSPARLGRNSNGRRTARVPPLISPSPSLAPPLPGSNVASPPSPPAQAARRQVRRRQSRHQRRQKVVKDLLAVRRQTRRRLRRARPIRAAARSLGGSESRTPAPFRVPAVRAGVPVSESVRSALWGRGESRRCTRRGRRGGARRGQWAGGLRASVCEGHGEMAGLAAALYLRLRVCGARDPRYCEAKWFV